MIVLPFFYRSRSGNPEMKKKADVLAQQMKDEDGVKYVVRAIEKRFSSLE